ncbi:hypothetical protein AB1207_24250 [Kineococcus endophyticus]|uniref:AbiJ-NTD3 domain-containing protein n=1 Tax=Kineococcus endophyticus TaxID=1181883 RepID=A0ABV3PDZ3_9ACTN
MTPEVIAQARHLVHGLVHELGPLHRHIDLAEVCVQYGLPAPPPEGPPEDAPEGPPRSKRDRLQVVLKELDAQPEPAYLAILAAFVNHGLAPAQRNTAEDLLWSLQAWPPISERVRREVAVALDEVGFPRHNPDGLMTVLHRLWVLEDAATFWGASGLAEEVQRHVVDNEDWTALQLFERLGALNAGDRRFALFLQALASHRVCPDETHQQAMVAVLNPALARAGVRMEQTGEDGGYPIFTLLKTGAARRPPQLLLFASIDSKPDLRLEDVLDQQIGVMNPDTVLRYDEPVGTDGFTGAHLLQWWLRRPDQAGRNEREAKANLWRRLRASLPVNSPPQRALFEIYHDLYARTTTDANFFALLPEVWVHWDPRTKSQRGAAALQTHRMDFLMLLPGNARIVIEVDGRQHYSDGDRPSPERYAATVRGGRQLQLSGYHVHRFGGAELIGEHARLTVQEFFDALLQQWVP